MYGVYLGGAGAGLGGLAGLVGGGGVGLLAGGVGVGPGAAIGAETGAMICGMIGGTTTVGGVGYVGYNVGMELHSDIQKYEDEQADLEKVQEALRHSRSN